MKVVKSEEYDAFQLTEENSLDNADWPSWMHEAWQREPDEQYSISRANRFRPDEAETVMVMRLADSYPAIHPGDWIIRNKHDYLRVRSNRIFQLDYMELTNVSS